jgi:hypothetical protein
MTVGDYSAENAVVPPERTLLMPIRCVMVSRRKAVAEGEMVKGRRLVAITLEQTPVDSVDSVIVVLLRPS